MKFGEGETWLPTSSQPLTSLGEREREREVEGEGNGEWRKEEEEKRDC